MEEIIATGMVLTIVAAGFIALLACVIIRITGVR